MNERPLDALAQAGDRAGESTDVGEADRRRGNGVRAERGRADCGERRGEVSSRQVRRVWRLRGG